MLTPAQPRRHTHKHALRSLPGQMMQARMKCARRGRSHTQRHTHLGSLLPAARRTEASCRRTHGHCARPHTVNTNKPCSSLASPSSHTHTHTRALCLQAAARLWLASQHARRGARKVACVSAMNTGQPAPQPCSRAAVQQARCKRHRRQHTVATSHATRVPDHAHTVSRRRSTSHVAATP